MYAIETELGRFEADTEKLAKKKMRDAARRQAKIDAEENRKHKLAHDQACKLAYSFYANRELKQKTPGWRYKPVGSYGCVEMGGDGGRKWAIECEGGRAVLSPYDPILGFVENGAGFCIAIHIANQDVELFPIAVVNGRAAWVPLYGFKSADFVRKAPDTE